MSGALYNGVMTAGGDVIVTMDADLQNDPADIPKLLEAFFASSTDVVLGVRLLRRDGVVKRLSSAVWNRFRGAIFGDGVEDSGCTLRVFKGEHKGRLIKDFDGAHRFVPTFAVKEGLKVLQREVSHRPRVHGESKFGVLNRFPEALYDAVGVMWLSRRSFWAKERGFEPLPSAPFIILGLIFLAVLTQMVAIPYGFKDDLVHLYPLHKYFGEGVLPAHPEATAIDGFMIWGARLLYIPVIALFDGLGFKYPIIAASKFWGLVLIPVTFFVWGKYLRGRLGAKTAYYAALAITAYGVLNETIPSGLMRAFGLTLLGLWALSVVGGSVWRIAAVFLAASFIYPVVLPLMGVSLAFIVILNWREVELKKRFMTLGAAFLASISNFILTPLLNSEYGKYSPMSYKEMINKVGENFYIEQLDIVRLSGRFGGQNLLEWLQFNLFYSWSRAPLWFHFAIIVIIALVAGLSLKLKAALGDKSKESEYYGLAGVIVIVGSALAFFKGDAHLAACWWALLSALTLALFTGRRVWREIPVEIRWMIPAGLVSFLFAFAVFSRFGFIVLEPGRQLQKAFSVVAPVMVVMWAESFFKRSRGESAKAIALAWFAVLLFATPIIGWYEYKDERVMAELKKLPQDSVIMAHPETANFILIMAGRGSSAAREFVRVGAEPYATNVLERYKRDIRALYSFGNSEIEEWCKEDSSRRYVLVESGMFTPREIARLPAPYNEEIEKRRQLGYFLDVIPATCRRPLSSAAYLVACSDIPKCFIGR